MTAPLMQKLPVRISEPQSDPVARKLLRGYLHKTSNSLCGIKGYASLMVGERGDRASCRKWARKIVSEIERMEDIFRSVGDLSKTRPAFSSGHNLAGVLGRAVTEAGPWNREMKISVSRLPESQLLIPEADLLLVLKEIVRNSAESGTCTKLEITGQVDLTGRVILRLVDNGPGMKPEILKQATDPFMSTRENHHGVGLTRVETLMDMHGLAWSLTSQPGVGTTVTMEVAEALAFDPVNNQEWTKGKQ